MRTKRVLGAVVALLILIGCLTGCGYNPETVMTVGDTDVPAGVFLALQMSAVSLASNEVGGEMLDGMTVYDTIIDEKPAKEWIMDKTDEMVREYVFIEQEFDRLELELDEWSAYYAEYMAQSTWQNASSAYEANGISYESLLKVYYNSLKRSAVMSELYGEGGEKEIQQEDIEAYFNEHYARLDYLSFPVMKVDGTSFSEEEKEEMYAIAERMLEQANGRQGLQRAFINNYEDVLRLNGEITDPDEEDEDDDHLHEEEENEPVVINEELFESIARLDTIVNDKETTLPEDFYAALLETEPGNTYYLYYEEGESLILYRRNNLHEDDSYENYEETIRSYISSEPFAEYVEEEAGKLEFVQNDRARKYYSLDKVKM